MLYWKKVRRRLPLRMPGGWKGGRLGVALSAALVCGCDWAAVDGPWNEETTQPSAPDLLRARGTVVTPDGGRSVAGVDLQSVDAPGEVVGVARSGAEGGWEIEGIEPGRYTLTATTGHFVGVAIVDLQPDPPEQEVEPIRLSGTTPIVLDVRSDDGGLVDPVDLRLTAMGSVSVRQGPETGADAAALFAVPQGLGEYGLVLVDGTLDQAPITDSPAALAGLVDFLEGGGGLYLSGEAWTLVDALAPGALEVHSERSAFGYVTADVVLPALSEELGWSRVGVPLVEGMSLPLAAGEGAIPWLRGDVETTSGALVETDLMVEIPFGAGSILYVPFRAPEPRADEWWGGSPTPWSLPDGSWDGRGAAVDRGLLRL